MSADAEPGAKPLTGQGRSLGSVMVTCPFCHTELNAVPVKVTNRATFSDQGGTHLWVTTTVEGSAGSEHDCPLVTYPWDRDRD